MILFGDRNEQQLELLSSAAAQPEKKSKISLPLGSASVRGRACDSREEARVTVRMLQP